MQKHILVLVLMFFAMSSSAWAECGKFCDRAWWKTATASDVQAELDAGADVMARSEMKYYNGYTPLHWATSYGNAEMVQLLIAAGADVDTRSESGITPLQNAAGSGTAEMVQLLITAGADVNTRSRFGHTPLIMAAEYGQAETVQLLITTGADITAKDYDGQTVWDGAQKNEELAGTEALWSLAEALGKCSKWCDAGWWRQITEDDLQALLDAGVYNKLTKKDRATAWNLAQSSPLKGSAAYWALNDAHYK